MTVAVVDLETTGLSPRVDRVVEVGVVLLDERGEVEGEFATLLNPGRDVGPTGLHGIRASDVVEAPTFADVAPHLRSLLSGRVVVAHNALFDLRFLAREFGRVQLPVDLSPSLCTMRLAPLFFGPGTRSLQALCGYLDIPFDHPHAALGDARATAELMVRMLSSDLGEAPLSGAGVRVRFAPDGTYRGFEPLDDGWIDLVAAARASAAVDPCPPCRTLPREESDAVARRRDGYLAQLVAALPALDDAPPSMAPYLTVLDQVLEDRLVSVTEADELFALAGELGCSPEHVMTAHRLYLDALATVAMADGVVTDDEHADLQRVAGLLGLDDRDVDLALTLVRSGAQVTLPRSLVAFAPGDRIVFTGAMSRTRAELEGAARAAGLFPTSSVSSKTDVLVCADPHSQSGKAMKARSLGVRVVSEAVFWEALAVAA
ncbi:DNA polymerase-3 subunit epsilon [Geodermatophilus siccatus]|uniref:DNA polymerase-3 subunit epsilon n=1 Tax=Geodermatophilus siccatus TaxID=1137991 RepID=A0A1G9R3Q1_9ACTN|nr:exonuclease domain-containing protein [Geodermatophilus siccatus]SDM17926.1 DNA polymerase-3 subunit epsilon [Geodermatophilus siccatus]